MMNYSSALLSSMTASALAAAAASAGGGGMSSPTIGGGSIRRSEVPGLPKGWIREEVPRSYNYHNGLGGGGMQQSGGGGGGRSEVVYYSPRGQRVRTKAEMSRLLGDAYDLAAFDFQTGKINPNLVGGGGGGGRSNNSVGVSSGSSRSNTGGGRPKQAAPSSRDQLHMASSSVPASLKTGNPSLGIRNDTSLVPPIRQTASIFKQPVSVKKYSKPDETLGPAAKGRADLKPTSAEKPRQLFWEKRLSGMRASYPDEVYEAFTLPSNFKAVGPGVQNDVVLASISTSLHMCNGEIKGQPIAKNHAEKDPALYLVPEQPLICATKISQDDVDKQEARVIATRKRLADALSALSA